MNRCESLNYSHLWKYSRPTKIDENGSELAYIATKRECRNCDKIQRVMWTDVYDGDQA